jgi:hypothetical protein
VLTGSQIMLACLGYLLAVAAFVGTGPIGLAMIGGAVTLAAGIVFLIQRPHA